MSVPGSKHHRPTGMKCYTLGFPQIDKSKLPVPAGPRSDRKAIMDKLADHAADMQELIEPAIKALGGKIVDIVPIACMITVEVPEDVTRHQIENIDNVVAGSVRPVRTENVELKELLDN